MEKSARSRKLVHSRKSFIVMTLVIVFGLIGIALYYFYNYNHRNRIRREERREEMTNRRQELLNRTLRANKATDSNEGNSNSNLPSGNE